MKASAWGHAEALLEGDRGSWALQNLICTTRARTAIKIELSASMPLRLRRYVAAGHSTRSCAEKRASPAIVAAGIRPVAASICGTTDVWCEGVAIVAISTVVASAVTVSISASKTSACEVRGAPANASSGEAAAVQAPTTEVSVSTTTVAAAASKCRGRGGKRNRKTCGACCSIFHDILLNHIGGRNSPGPCGVPTKSPHKQFFSRE